MSGELMGTVQAVHGVVRALAPNGQPRILLLGDPIHVDDIVVTGAGAGIVIQGIDDSTMTLGSGQTVTISDDLSTSAGAAAAQPGAEAVDPLIDQVLGGGDLDALLQPTAAGAPGNGAEEGHSFVQLLRVLEPADSARGPTTAGLIPNALIDETPLTVPTPTAEAGALVVGSNASDRDGSIAPAAHTVDTSPFAPDGAIDGGRGDDILIGDTGGTGLQPGQIANVVFVLDTSGSMRSDIEFTNAAGETSTITRLEAMIQSTKAALNALASSGAEAVRVHIIEFGTTSRTLGTFDILDPDQLQAAFAALDAPPADTGFTNYEAGLTLAQRWIEGGSYLSPISPTALSFVDANRDDGGSNNDRAYILGRDGEPLALVSAWGSTTGDLRDAVTTGTGSFGVEGGISSESLDPGEVLRFDFGAFDDFDGAGPYQNTAGFNASAVMAASFVLGDNGLLGADAANDTLFAYTITFTDGSEQSGTALVDGGATLTLQGTQAHLGKSIAHIAFAVTGGDGGAHGHVALTSVTQVAISGILPDADIHRVVFVSDSEPNYALDDANRPIAVDDQIAIDHVLGLADAVNEVGAIENTSNLIGPAFTIEAIGINLSGLSPNDAPIQLPVTNELSQLEGSGGSATDVATANDLAEILGQIAGGDQLLLTAGDDVINGGAGNDLILGDVPFTDALARDQGLSLPVGAGWNVFSALEAGAGTTASWTRADTLAYLAENLERLSTESGRPGGNDQIDAGDGDDLVYGQEGNDQITGGAGRDVLIGGSGADTFVFRLADVGDGTGDASALDTIADFTLGIGGDALDLRDLLQGEESANTAVDLSSFLRFTSDGTQTTLNISASGDGIVNQRIELSGIDLTAGGFNSDSQIVQTLLNGNQLLRD